MPSKHEVVLNRRRTRPANETEMISGCLENYLLTAYPYCVPGDVNGAFEKDSTSILEAMSFFRIAGCTIEKTDEISVFFQQKMRKLLAAAYSSGIPVCFGFIGREDGISLVLGLDPYSGRDDVSAQSVREIAQGILPGIALENYNINSPIAPTSWGMIEAVPSMKLDDEKQKADYTGLLRCLNGREFNILIMARPIPVQKIREKIKTLRDSQTECSALLKTTVSSQEGTAHTDGTTNTTAQSTFSSHSVGFNFGGNVGIGEVVGISAGASYGYSRGKSETKSVSDMVSDTISHCKSLGYEVQDYFVKEIIDYCEDAARRFNLALAGGGWDTCISYSATEESTLEIIQGYLFSEIVKPDPLKPQAAFQTLSFEDVCEMTGDKTSGACGLLIPDRFLEKDGDCPINPLVVPLNSEELGMLFAFPESSVPGFELRIGKFYALSAAESEDDDCRIGTICEGERMIDNAPFTFSRGDIAKHVFICGITGCGKTTSVKRILVELNGEKDSAVPFLVLECAKKEYRNLAIADRPLTVYTPGHPEIHSPQMNPFYIQPGISLQTHIDYLKDLFNASFSFYGPMPYILEKCLQRIYEKRGWNLTTGDHPLLINSRSMIDRYDAEVLAERYAVPEHRFLFPTMRDLLNEVGVCVKELQYDAELTGNIRGAMGARLESLCNGAKGFMFNNAEPADMRSLLNENAVMELEGLSDDSDKAFAVGLLIIFINEYRQSREVSRPLEHVLVIEEAHRLLKNVATERFSEDMGNPKGKAVEHFTNMLAEMRSFGQGVIIAEQIPSKIAPDVIKNSSNKIIHRLVARDDQEFVANTIGVDADDAIYFGALKPGFALCHKEGMFTPVSVKVEPVADKRFTDQMIRERMITDQTPAILLHQIKNNDRFPLVPDYCVYSPVMFRLLNSLLWLYGIARSKRKKQEDYKGRIDDLSEAVRCIVDEIVDETQLVLTETPANDIRKAAAAALAEQAVALLLGFYKVHDLPNGMFQILTDYFFAPSAYFGEVLNVMAGIDPHVCLLSETIRGLMAGVPHPGRERIETFFLVWDDEIVDKIYKKMLIAEAKQ